MSLSNDLNAHGVVYVGYGTGCENILSHGEIERGCEIVTEEKVIGCTFTMYNSGMEIEIMEKVYANSEIEIRIAGISVGMVVV